MAAREVRSELAIDLDQGRRYSWGYPACPDQSEHEKVWRLLGLENIGMTLSDGYAVTPEQSTVAIIAHHPQAVYFGMKSGFVPKEKAPDELIADTERGGDCRRAEPAEGTVEDEGQRRAAGRSPGLAGSPRQSARRPRHPGETPGRIFDTRLKTFHRPARSVALSSRKEAKALMSSLLATADDLRQAVDGTLADTVPVNTLWVVIAAVLVLFMQAGFAMLEIGFSRAKNAGTGVAKILTNLSIAAICYWAVGFAFAFGSADVLGISSAIIGTNGFFLQCSGNGLRLSRLWASPTPPSRPSGSSSSRSARCRWRSSGARPSSESSTALT